MKATNHGGKFEQSFEEKYLLELELKKEHSANAVDVLELYITLKDDSFSNSLFDKRDDFQFIIVRMLFRTSIILTKILYSVIGAEVIKWV